MKRQIPLPRGAYGVIQMKVIVMKDKKTIREWEKEFELNIVDMDGFNKRDPLLFERLFSKEEFERAIADCTVIHKSIYKKPREEMRPFVQQKQYSHSKLNKMSRKQTKINIRWHRVWLLYVLFTIPVAVSFLLKYIYKILARKISIRWYYPAGLGIMSLFILFLEPVTTLIAGPLYLWYLILSIIASLLGALYFKLAESLFHKGILPPSHEPFLSGVNLSGNPMNLYFSLGKAVTSSIVIAVLIVCASDLYKRFAGAKSAH